MAGEQWERAGAALRALASPLSVGALVLLVVNDHVLKEAWPGWVTGKLSDVAGLVVAPLLVAVPLALLGVRRPAGRAALAVAVVFTVVKVVPVAAATLSSLLSAVAGPSYVRSDVTDLLAVPAVLVAVRVHRTATRGTGSAATRTAVGAALLPFVVLGTAATGSCGGYLVGQDVVVAAGRWGGAGAGPPSRLVVGGSLVLWADAAGRLRSGRLQDAQTRALREQQFGRPRASGRVCDPAAEEHCWAAVRTGDRFVVRETTDEGRTWRTVARLTHDEIRAILSRSGTGCGKPQEVGISGLGLLATPRGPLVVAAYKGGSLLVRTPDGRWVHDPPVREPLPPPTPRTPLPGSPVPTPSAVPGPVLVSPASTVSPTPSPVPPCPSPLLVTVTPNPRNGPPTVEPRCPIPSGP